MVDDTTTGGVISGTQQHDKVRLGAMPEQVIRQLQDNPGADFIVIQRLRQSEEPYIWASGDATVTQDLFRTAYTGMAFDVRSTQPA